MKNIFNKYCKFLKIDKEGYKRLFYIYNWLGFIVMIFAVLGVFEDAQREIHTLIHKMQRKEFLPEFFMRLDYMFSYHPTHYFTTILTFSLGYIWFILWFVFCTIMTIKLIPKIFKWFINMFRWVIEGFKFND